MNLKEIDKLYNEGLRVIVDLDRLRKEIELEILLNSSRLYNSMESINHTELYSKGRYVEWQNKLDAVMIKYYREQVSLMTKAFSDVYIKANPINSPIEKRFIEKVLNKEWAGRNFKDSIWGNTNVLKKQVRKQLLENISTGKGIDNLSSDLAKRFDVNRHRANTLARSETQFFINQGQKDRYVELGIEKYEFSAEIDSVTTRECKKMHKRVFRFTQARVGYNMPPLHANCRSTILPVIED